MASTPPSLELPDKTVLAALLRERHELETCDLLEINAYWDDTKSPTLKLSFTRSQTDYRPRENYEITIAQNTKPQSWDAIVDALDALFGTLLDNGFSYRDLPSGHNVEHGAERFDVQTLYFRPDLEAVADQMLKGN